MLRAFHLFVCLKSISALHITVHAVATVWNVSLMLPGLQKRDYLGSDWAYELIVNLK